jgi:hypothetical protein
MAIDYLVDMDCPVKDELTKEGLVSMIKQRNYANAVMDVLKKEGKPDEEIMKHEFRVQRMTPGGIEEKPQKISDLLECTRHLDTLGAHCKTCYFGGNGIGHSDGNVEPFGCLNGINYPISRKAEEWLADMARDAVAKGGSRLLVLNYILDNKVSGHEINKLRGRQGRFLELSKPLKVVLSNGLVGKKAVDTDQIMCMLFGPPAVEPTQMVMLLLFAGALKFYAEKPDRTVCQMTTLVKANDLPEMWWAFDLRQQDGEDRSVTQLKHYFRSMFLACSIGKNITIDR